MDYKIFHVIWKDIIFKCNILQWYFCWFIAVRRKSQHKIKDSHKSLILVGKEAKCSLPATNQSVKDAEKKVNLKYSQLGDIASITALCKGIKIQEKQTSSISVKQVPYARKTLTSNTPTSKIQSPFRASVENAMAEYTKKSQASVTQSMNQRRKVSNEESPKTTKVYLSEKQSGVLSDCGVNFPCAPPATPTAGK